MAEGAKFENDGIFLRIRNLDSTRESGLARYALLAMTLTGLFILISTAVSFIRLQLSLFLLPGKNLRNYGQPDSWAVVTGASDGIGKEFAIQLAKKGFNILLVSRTASKLSALAENIGKETHVETKTLAMDFAANNDTDYGRLQTMTTKLDVAILINNVGRSHNIPVLFSETPPEEVKDIIAINCTGTLRVTALVLPDMISRRRGLILTMGSFGGLLPTPLLATYSGSKAFLQQWSSALGAEVAPHNIDVELVQSYLVTSAMSKIRRPSIFIPTPKDFVGAVLARIGRTGGAQGWAYTSTPYWSHAIIQWALGAFVGFTNSVVIRQNKKMHEGIRKRALTKRAGERDSQKKSL